MRRAPSSAGDQVRRHRLASSSGRCRRAARRRCVSASQPTTGATGSCRCTTSGANARSSRRSVEIGRRACPRGWRRRRWRASRSCRRAARATPAASRACGRAPRCSSAVRARVAVERREDAHSCPRASSSPASASMWRVTPPGYVHEYGETRATRIDGMLGTASDRLRSASPPGRPRISCSSAMPERHFVKYTFLKVDPAWRRLDAERARRAQARVPRRLRGLRRRAAAARVLAGRHARRRRPDAAHAGDEPRAHPRVPRRARAERADEVVRDPVLVPGADQAVRVLRRVAPRGPPAHAASTCSSTRS